jgi:amphiphysin
MKKLQDKKEKTLKDEKALYAAENALEAATQDYNYFNDMMKEELPTLFALEADFIRPLFQNFYYMQLNIFYTLNEKMRTMEIDYFDFNVDIEEQYNAKRGDVKEQAEQLSIVHFKGTGRKRKPLSYLRTNDVAATFAGKSKYASEKDRKSAVSSTYGSTHRRSTSEQPPPPYSAAANGVSSTTGKALGRSSSLASAAAGKKPPPPPAPKPSTLSRKEHAVALYDYTAQAEGDLTFKAGDRIEIIRKGDDANEWWIGRLNGEEGQFPANYTQLEK